MRDDGTYKTRITHTNGADILPVFSPDGRYLMWTTTRGPEKASQIWVARFHLPKGS
jgi:Tol biopolymer transport system component